MKKILLYILLFLNTTINFSQEIKPFRNKEGKLGFKNEQGKVIAPAIFDNYIDYEVDINNKIKVTILSIGGEIKQAIKNVGVESNGNLTVSPFNYYSKEAEYYILYNNKLSKPYKNIRVLQNIFDDFDNMPQYIFKPIVEEGFNNLPINTEIDSLTNKYGFDIEDINSKLNDKYKPVIFYHKLPEELLFIVKENNKWGAINSNFENVLNNEFDKIEMLSNNTFSVWKDNKNGIIDCNRKEIVPIKYNWFDYQITNGTRLVFNGELTEGDPLKGKYGLIDTLGNEIVPIKFDHYKRFNLFNEEKPLFTIFNNGSSYKEFLSNIYITDYLEDSEPQTEINYSLKEEYINEGEFVLFTNNKISKAYQSIKVLTLLFSEYESYSIDISSDNEYTYKNIVVDTLSQVVASNEIDRLIRSRDGFGEYDDSIIDSLNIKISNLNEKYIFEFKSKPELFYIVKENGKWGVINSNYEVIIPCSYIDINSSTFNNQFCFIANNGKQNYYIDTKGKLIK